MNRSRPGFWKRLGRKVDRLRGRPVEFDLRPYENILAAIDARAHELDLVHASEHGLHQQVADLREKADRGARTDDLLVDCYALVREVALRTLKLRPFDEQMLAAIALHRGRLVEMQTGEGKTLAAVLPVVLNALGRQGVHVLTFNNYLAARDADWMRPVYGFMGLRVEAVVEGMSDDERRQAYAADVTYLTAKEAGYDYLRESIVRHPDKLFARPYHFAIVDEADSILIDEARVPLVIAGSDDEASVEDRSRLARLVRKLIEGTDFQTDENRRNVFLNDSGVEKMQQWTGCADLHAAENLGLLTRINQALHAQVLLAPDVDYIVRNGRVEVVDEFTGRSVPDRHWPDGLHRALEAKEGLELKDQGRILNSISMQHFIGLYPRLSGMTGTALPADRELFEFYGLETVVIPPHKTCMRNDLPDMLFADLASKHDAVVDEVVRANRRGQPVLIGTHSVRESEQLARGLRQAGVACQVLNAVNDAAEAEIVKQAGLPRAVTVSTNMAGRGTDIRLGGADERDRDVVAASGGLYVIGTNRHESRRIDDQLRGRTGRQGDPGMSRFFISLQDPLMQKFGIAGLLSPRQASRVQPGAAIADPGVHKKVAIIQHRIEGQNLDIRRTLWKYSSCLEEKRLQVHEQRRQVLCVSRPLSDATGHHFEQQVQLHHLDQAWCDYLAHVADVREAIYLNVLGGRDPLQEFMMQAARAFVHMEQVRDERIRELLDKAHAHPGDLSLLAAGIKGPSSTWTYLINDNPFEWRLSLGSHRNFGAGAWAGVLAGLFWFIPVGYRLGQWLARFFGHRVEK